MRLLHLAAAVAIIVSRMNAQDDAFRQMADRYFDEVYFHYAPTAGTSAGFHQYDTKLEDYSAGTIHEEATALKRELAEFERLDPGSLSVDVQLDRELVIS